MALDRITASEYGDIIATGINDRDATLDTRIGTIRDIFIDPVAEVLEQQNNRIVYLSNLTSLKFVDNVVADDLDNILYNEGLVRWQGSKAVTTVTFARKQAPTADIVIPSNLPLNTTVDPATGVSVIFRTIESRTMSAAAAASYYNADTEKYEIDVAVSSVVVGTQVSVGAYTISVMRRQVPGIDEIYNKQATTSGRSTETNQEAADRYLLHVEGSQLGTPAGIKRSILDTFSGVSDAYVVYGNDSFLTREQDDAGAVDIWVMGSTPATKTEITTYPGIETLMPVERNPLVEVLAVSSGGVPYTEGTDYEVVTGEGFYSYSNRGADGIKFITGGTSPTVDAPVTVEYTYNSLIDLLVSYYTQPEYYSVGMDKMYRWAQEEPVTIEANLKVKSGDPSSVSAAVRNAVTSYINSLLLGDNLERFDVDAEVAKVRGVDNWVYEIFDVVGGSGVDDIEIDPKNYARIEDANLVINLV